LSLLFAHRPKIQNAILTTTNFAEFGLSTLSAALDGSGQ
jgi:hypothetical protein